MTIITFYSFKGGTGRTMALANVAWILAANGKRVLAADWDLESPGLPRYFAPFLSPGTLESNRGVLGLLQDHQSAMMSLGGSGREPDHAGIVDLDARVLPLAWNHFPEGGGLDLLPAGRLTRDYRSILDGIDLGDFFTRLDGARFFEVLSAEMTSRYDYVLIDSRTGYSEVADVCVLHLPDVLVDCFTLNEQGIDGAIAVARSVEEQRRDVRILPVMMRVDPAEKAKMDARRAFVKDRLRGLPETPDQESRDQYWNRVWIPYQAYYSFEEVLAAFGDAPGSQNTMLAAYETLTSAITHGAVGRLPSMPLERRLRVERQFQQRVTLAETSVTLRYATTDQAWGEWMTALLIRAGVDVIDLTTDPGADTAGSRDLLIVAETPESLAALRWFPADPSRPEPLVVGVGDSVLARPHAISLAGKDEKTAADAVLRLIGWYGTLPPGTAGSRYPNGETLIVNLEQRNVGFTGREEALTGLRRQLLSNGTAAGQPGTAVVVLQGPGGIGKTQIALEYAHRYRDSYDLVCWVTADPVTAIETQLGALGVRIGVPPPLTGGGTGYAHTVLDMLARGATPHRNWLLIYDNAEDPEPLLPFLPHGGCGHVLVTARTPEWSSRAETLPVGGFSRAESVDHLHRRVKAGTPEDAARLAEQLDDLPIAIDAVAALLADGSYTIAQVLGLIRRAGAETTPLRTIWAASLGRLRERSPGAYRLLQLISVMDTSVARELIDSNEIAEALTPIDPGLQDRMARSRLVQAISRLGLARTDRIRADRSTDDLGGARVTVHRLIQQFVRDTMTGEELNATRHQVHVALVQYRPGGEVEDPATWPAFRVLWSHLAPSGAEHCERAPVRQLLIDQIRHLWLVGDFLHGRTLAERIEGVWQHRLRDTAVAESDRRALRRQLLDLQFNKANLIRSMGDFAGSLAVDQAVLAGSRELTEDPHDLLVLAAANSLGGDLRGLGRYQEALDSDRQTYEALAEEVGEEHQRTLASLNNLAVSHRLMGDYRQARDLDERVLSRRRAALGERHPHTLQSMGHLGRDHREEGDYGTSVAILEETAALFGEKLGRDSREALNADVNLAISLRCAGDLTRARMLLDRAYNRLSLGLRTAPDALACRLSRAVSMLSQAASEAREEMIAVLYDFTTAQGAPHPQTLACANNLAMAELLNDDPREAHRLAGEVAPELAEVVGADHPYTLTAEANLGLATASCGDHARAREILSDVVRRTVTRLGENHPDVRLYRANLELIGERPVMDAVREGRLRPRLIDPLPF
ncbi:FxSxx-COOH system tetratricopeptide repeat protein [Actinoplanes sp. NPDC051851]|uniref:FxSxx-COOH system tetratricopeptide repeat protein n=1 Tax=Actinoplanes sp. NPDC051851 TaxID=3154753 RepID=UPI003437C869